ncbi:hypothetical protein J6590_026358 [Homalodisca vitripennis]|nr:hypothetical protein J6590_026358 [Homalodisca vitripennis]
MIEWAFEKYASTQNDLSCRAHCMMATLTRRNTNLPSATISHAHSPLSSTNSAATACSAKKQITALHPVYPRVGSPIPFKNRFEPVGYAVAAYWSAVRYFLDRPRKFILRLSQNFLSQIKEGTFDELASLKQIDLTNNPLVCDCGLWWILEWARNTSVKFSPLPKCSAPPLLRGQPLRKLKGGSQCAWPQSEFDSAALELNPNHNQVVFEGDTLHLQCRALTAEVDADDTVSWVWADRDPAEVFHQTIQVQNKHIRDNGFIER